ncbi:MAG: S1 RNA-binding domain-containing protein, partial [Hydrogenophaga sp.]
GVHQDGLVHVSQLANRFVNDAREVVKTGDIVKVKVMEVDVARKRIGLSMKLDAEPGRRDRDAGAARGNRFEPARGAPRSGFSAGQGNPRQAEPAGAMASAFARLQTRDTKR